MEPASHNGTTGAKISIWHDAKREPLLLTAELDIYGSVYQTVSMLVERQVERQKSGAQTCRKERQKDF